MRRDERPVKERVATVRLRSRGEEDGDPANQNEHCQRTSDASIVRASAQFVNNLVNRAGRVHLEREPSAGPVFRNDA